MNDYEHCDNDSDISDSPDHPIEPQRSGQKKSRTGNACLTCRRMKTRCEYFDDDSPCKLCARSNRECVKAPARRKRRKTVTRIADLEQRIQSLTSALIDNKTPPDDDLLSRHVNSTSPPDPRQQAKPMGVEKPRRPESVIPDVIDKGRVDKVTAFAAFHRYREQMDCFYGFVPLPRDLDIDRYRRRKPMLFSTIVLAGLNAIRPDLVPVIADDILKSLSDRIHYRAERSLELVQSLLVYMCYHCRTLQREHLTFYQNISTALTMALDLGLGRRMGKTKLKYIADEDMYDARRAYLACYYMSGQAAISLRHPLFIRWGPYIEECLDVLSSNPNPFPDDIWLVDLIRLHRIAEDTHTIFSMDDPASVLSLKDPKTQYHLNALEQQLDRWRKEAKSDPSSLRVRLCSTTVNMFIHEIALHSHQNIDSFRSPPDPERLATFFNDMDIGPARIDSLCTCLSSAQLYLDSLLALSINDIRCLPNMYFVRSGYAAMTLKWLDEINMEVMSPAGSHSSPSSSSNSSAAAGRSSHTLTVNLDYYMDNVILLYEKAGQDGKCNIATAFLQCFRMLKAVKLLNTTGNSSVPTAGAQRASAEEPTRSNPQPRTSYQTEEPQPQPQLPIPQIQNNPIQNPYVTPELDFNPDLPEFDTTMFDVNALNNFDPGFTTMGFWNLGGWSNAGGEGDVDVGFLGSMR